LIGCRRAFPRALLSTHSCGRRAVTHVVQGRFALAFGGVIVAAARRASASRSAPVNQLHNEVRGLLATRAILGLIFYASLGAWLVVPEAVPWAYVAVPPALRWLGVCGLLPLLALFTWSFGALGTNYRGGVGLYDDHRLVTTGPYRFVRHPIYIVRRPHACIFLISANWVLGLSGLLLTLSFPRCGSVSRRSSSRSFRCGLGRIPEAYRSLSSR
jgi:protein-S-isoprenylcysteine O-methyltransferase Ste14